MIDFDREKIKTALPASLKEDWEYLIEDILDSEKNITVCFLGAFSVGKTSLINSFAEKYGNGPDRPSNPDGTADVMLGQTVDEKAEQPTGSDG